eukprot:SAG31_NODE_9371_length_1289_cov_1.240336_1_plen_49_part_10
MARGGQMEVQAPVASNSRCVPPCAHIWAVRLHLNAKFSEVGVPTAEESR